MWYASFSSFSFFVFPNYSMTYRITNGRTIFSKLIQTYLFNYWTSSDNYNIIITESLNCQRNHSLCFHQDSEALASESWWQLHVSMNQTSICVIVTGKLCAHWVGSKMLWMQLWLNWLHIILCTQLLVYEV